MPSDDEKSQRFRNTRARGGFGYLLSGYDNRYSVYVCAKHRRWRRLSLCDNSYPPAPTQSYYSITSSDFIPAFSLKEHTVSQNHSVFREAKNCEAPRGNYFLPPASSATAGIFYMPREQCAAGVKKSPSRRMGFGLSGAPAQRKSYQKETPLGRREKGAF